MSVQRGTANTRRSRSVPRLLPLLLAALCLAAVPLSVAHAKDCATRASTSMIAWRHDQGSFQCDNCVGAQASRVVSGAVPRQWTEYNKERRVLNVFVEEHRDGAQLVLRDDARGVSILLRNDLCGVRTEAEQNFRQLYGGTFMSVVDCT
ncbi:hypothetical protein NESM_000414500 [Novymonas esmeraldas]|uniref:Uncharacterized protein n=1 Tax=Novymonas esmeraldas TaxID=1808958 RepID=A0AAW0EL95_9TRYP